MNGGSSLQNPKQEGKKPKNWPRNKGRSKGKTWALPMQNLNLCEWKSLSSPCFEHITQVMDKYRLKGSMLMNASCLHSIAVNEAAAFAARTYSQCKLFHFSVIVDAMLNSIWVLLLG